VFVDLAKLDEVVESFFKIGVYFGWVIVFLGNKVSFDGRKGTIEDVS
jgi:hypothetical protein